LERTVNSVLSQNFKDFEIIIVDDGSTDNTEQLTARLFSNYGRIRYFKTNNRERGAARNYGLLKARGKYVCFLDSDDVLLYNHLAAINQVIIANPQINFLVTKYRIKDETGHIIHNQISSLREGLQDYRILLKGNMYAALLCVKKSNPGLIKFIEDRKFSSMEDWIFNFQNAMNDSFYLIDKCTVEMLDHPGRSMANNEMVINKRLLATNYLLEHLSLPKHEEQILKTYSFLFCTIHSILDNKRMQALYYLRKAIWQKPFKAIYLLLIVKIFVGQSLINKLRGRA